MASYFFIQSLDSIANSKTDDQFRLMQELAARDNKVQVLLVQNAVFMAKAGTQCQRLDALIDKGISIYVDDFSLAQRGITSGEIRPKFKTAEISCVIDALLDKQKVIWN
jgi:sulfur transfer complex TusBCD TusB component (DsrH family)